MTAMNIVRMKVKAGQEGAFLAAHEARRRDDFEGMKSFRIVKTGDRDYLVVGEWESMDALSAARPKMIATLDSFRETLEDLGGDLGVTEPRSGEVVFSI